MREKALRGLSKTLVILGLLGSTALTAPAQAMAEAGALSSNSSLAAQSTKTPPPTMASPAIPSSSPHLLATSGPPPSERNRKDFEDNAGEDAGRVLFRSIPAGAEILINDLIVGRTPLLLDIAPGKYRIDMRGPRLESGGVTVGVLPKETQTVVVNLKQRYPASISIH